jgi:DNA-binding response OmpR family regulator
MPKILIVEDDEMQLKILSVTLVEEGYDLFTTADGPQGISIYKNQQPDLVLLDIGLPSMSGIEVLREIKKINNKAKVIVVTGYGSVESAVAAIRFGAWDYVQKPFDVRMLLKKIESALHVKID